MIVILQYACVLFAFAALAYQFLSCGIAIVRCRFGKPLHRPDARPPVTVVRPVRGLETFSRETLGSTFDIAYPDYEILFCVEDRDDPVVPLVHALIAAHPERDASILIGTDRLGDNPKLNNMAKGFRAARFEHIVFVDSNVFTPADYLDQLVHMLEEGAGMVSAPPIGMAPLGFWAGLECAFLNSYQARIQYAVDSLGMGFAQGKTLFFRKADLRNGGLARLASEPAEDAAATKMMRAAGRQVRLAGPFPQLIGRRSFRQVWQRQVRWARLRRASFPLLFAPECLAGGLPPAIALLFGLQHGGLASTGAVLGFLAAWYLPEMILLRIARWPGSPAILVLRDLLLPLVFIAGCAGQEFEWHGRTMSTARHAKASRMLASVRPRQLWARWAGR